MAATPVFTNLASQAELVDADNIVTSRIAWAFAPHEQAVPNMTVRVDAGSIFNGNVLNEIAAQSTVTITAPVGNPRIDRIVIDQISGAVSVVTGTPAVSPTAPAIPGGALPIAQLALATSTTAITNNLITDERNLWSLGGNLRAIVVQNGMSYTYSMTDNDRVILRSYSGTMSDVLPGTALPAQWQVTIVNDNSADLLSIKPGGTKTLDGSTDFVYIGPGQQITIISDGSNYHSLSKPDRCRLAADVTVYVATGGADSNDGLTSAAAWATIQHAWDVARAQFDLAGHRLTVQLAAGTYMQSLTATGYIVGSPDAAGMIFLGDISSASSVTVDATSGSAINASNHAGLYVRGMTLKGNYGINAQYQSFVVFDNLIFGACPSSHIYAEGQSLVSGSTYAVTGNAGNHWYAIRGGLIQAAGTAISITGTLNISTWARSELLGNIHCFGASYGGTGTVLGTKYAVSMNSIINSGTTLPGSSAGSTATGGQYV